MLFDSDYIFFKSQTFKMEVKEPPQGVTPPVQSTIRRSSQQPSRLRKFVLQNSAGLRIRTHPSLQSEQIGVVHVNGTIAFVDEVCVLYQQFIFSFYIV